MRCWFISDTHEQHESLQVPDNIDTVFHAGDAANNRAAALNAPAYDKFLQWYSQLPIPNKVLIAGNHDTAVERNFIGHRKFAILGITYLQHQEAHLTNGLHLFGSPYTPSFGEGWAFNVARHKLYHYWSQMPANLDVLITHGPPKGILDLASDQYGNLEQCGCAALYQVIKTKQPKLHVFGHLHTESDKYNAGLYKDLRYPTLYINAAVVDLKHNLINNGQVLEYCPISGWNLSK